jgi:hypothetical protein
MEQSDTPTPVSIAVEITQGGAPDTILPLEPAGQLPTIVLRRTPRAVGKRLRWRVFVRDNFTCQACGRSPEKNGVALHADHKVAYSNGGETIFENLQALCEDCNLGKSNL